MDNQFEEDEQARSNRRAQNIEKMKREKEKQKQQREQFRRYAPIAGGAFCAVVVLIAGGVALARSAHSKTMQEQNMAQIQTEEETSQSVSETEESSSQEISTEEETKAPFVTQTTVDTKAVSSEVVSENAIIIEENTGNILAQRDAYARISPASMTKVLTVLVAAEHVENLDDTYTITLAETDYSYSNDCSNAGFDVDEQVTIRDLFYGTILPSGADAAVGLAAYVAGSHEAFVDMMNEKLKELGLSDTAHMTNCVGLYDENHYCTVYDMAVILKEAMDNPLCREVMSAHTYNTSSTSQHPDGILLSNWFLRRIEDKECGGEVLCAKTGYVVQSGNCAASYCLDKNGNGYLCVTAHSTSGWRCIYDHVALYQQFLNKL
mgnify:FL=1